MNNDMMVELLKKLRIEYNLMVIPQDDDFIIYKIESPNTLAELLVDCNSDQPLTEEEQEQAQFERDLMNECLVGDVV